VLLKYLALVGLVAALSACGGHASAPASNLPPGCSKAEVDNILADFLVDPVTAPPGFFTSISITDPDGRKFVTSSGRLATEHLRARLQAGEDDRLTALAIGPIDFNHVSVAFRLKRTAPDFARRHITNHVAQGTGVIDCVHEQVASLTIKPG
jgi:hypothetical protein